MEAIILAGGLGTRLRSVVPSLPKTLAPVKKKPFLAYLLDFWIAQGVNRFVLSVGYKHEIIQNTFGNQYMGAELDYAVEALPLGTGGGLILSSQKLRSTDPFLILNGDTFFDVNLIDLLERHSTCKAEITLSLVKVADDSRYNLVVLDDKGFVRSLKIRSEKTQSNWANGGVYVMKPCLLKEYASVCGKNFSLENELLPNLIKKKKRIIGFLSNGDFIDIGLPEDYLRAKEILLRSRSN